MQCQFHGGDPRARQQRRQFIKCDQGAAKGSLIDSAGKQRISTAITVLSGVFLEQRVVPRGLKRELQLCLDTGAGEQRRKRQQFGDLPDSRCE